MNGFEAFDASTWLDESQVLLVRPSVVDKVAKAVRHIAGYLVVGVAMSMATGGTAWAAEESFALQPKATCVVVMPAQAALTLRVTSAATDLARPEYWGELVSEMKTWRAVNEVSARIPAPMF